MKEILKRLEIIKNSIDIDDKEIIEFQIIKLKKLDIDDDIKEIVSKLEDLDYGLAMVEIEKYLSRYSGLSEYADSELQGLKLELKALENNLQDLVAKKSEYLNDIDEFNTLYNLKLGPIIKKILKLKEEILAQSIKEEKKDYEETKKNIKEIEETLEKLEEMLEDVDEDSEDYDEIYDAYEELQEELENLQEELKKAKQSKDDPLDKEYEEAKRDYEEFSNQYEDVQQKAKEIFELDESSKKELKALYKKASKLSGYGVVVDNK